MIDKYGKYCTEFFTSITKEMAAGKSRCKSSYIICTIHGGTSFSNGSPTPRSKAKTSFIYHNAWTFDAWFRVSNGSRVGPALPVPDLALTTEADCFVCLLSFPESRACNKNVGIFNVFCEDIAGNRSAEMGTVIQRRIKSHWTCHLCGQLNLLPTGNPLKNHRKYASE